MVVSNYAGLGTYVSGGTRALTVNDINQAVSNLNANGVVGRGGEVIFSPRITLKRLTRKRKAMLFLHYLQGECSWVLVDRDENLSSFSYKDTYQCNICGKEKQDSFSIYGGSTSPMTFGNGKWSGSSAVTITT